jgi:hypothetical protein
MSVENVPGRIKPGVRHTAIALKQLSVLCYAAEFRSEDIYWQPFTVSGMVEISQRPIFSPSGLKLPYNLSTMTPFSAGSMSGPVTLAIPFIVAPGFATFLVRLYGVHSTPIF